MEAYSGISPGPTTLKTHWAWVGEVIVQVRFWGALGTEFPGNRKGQHRGAFAPSSDDKLASAHSDKVSKNNCLEK